MSPASSRATVTRGSVEARRRDLSGLPDFSLKLTVWRARAVFRCVMPSRAVLTDELAEHRVGHGVFVVVHESQPYLFRSEALVRHGPDVSDEVAVEAPIASADSSGRRLHRVQGEADEAPGNLVPQSQVLDRVALAGADVDEQREIPNASVR